jgi:hypothetical protein
MAEGKIRAYALEVKPFVGWVKCSSAMQGGGDLLATIQTPDIEHRGHRKH